jgi:hypothetical protein
MCVPAITEGSNVDHLNWGVIGLGSMLPKNAMFESELAHAHYESNLTKCMPIGA